MTKLFEQRPALAKAPLVPMQSLELKARDGLTLVSYLSLPPGSDTNGDGRPDKPVPLVLNVHGGPWARDGYGFNSEHQWLANRGYAVLAVNYRGSTGFGKGFVNASNKQWAAQDARRPDRRRAVGHQGKDHHRRQGRHLRRLVRRLRHAGRSHVHARHLRLRRGHRRTFEPRYPADLDSRRTGRRSSRNSPCASAIPHRGRQKLLAERSPLTRVAAIKKPLLIAQGANDPRVKQAEADQIVKAMKDKNLPVTYVLYPEEGHGFARPTNRTSFYAIAEGFLSQCLGGRYEPIGNDFKGANLKVLEGAQQRARPGRRTEVRMGTSPIS